MATTTTLANNVLLPGPPVLLTQAQTPAPYSPSPAPCLLRTPVCPAGASCLLSSVLLPGSCPGILPPLCLCLHLHCRQTPPVQHLCHHELPLLPEVAVSCLPPKASVGFEGSGFAYQQKGGVPYMLCHCKTLIFLQPNCILSQRAERFPFLTRRQRISRTSRECLEEEMELW